MVLLTRLTWQLAKVAMLLLQATAIHPWELIVSRKRTLSRLELSFRLPVRQQLPVHRCRLVLLTSLIIRKHML